MTHYSQTPMNRGTVTVHTVDGTNDILTDNQIVDVGLLVAIDHENNEVIDADIRYDLLERRLRRDGWNVVDEDDVFIHNGDRWVAKEDNQ